jgi:glycosyltransferase EpsE
LKPLVSVVMGTYNPTRIIYDAVHSILNQSFKEFEFIIYNDGSNDINSKEILKDISLLDKRIVLINSEINRGLAHALNECIKISKSNFLIRMDDDDISDLKRIEILFSQAQFNPTVSIIGTAANYFDEKGQWGKISPPFSPTINDILNSRSFVHASTLIRKDHLEEVNFYSEGEIVNRLEDFDLWMKLYLQGRFGINIPSFLYHIREDEFAYKKRTLPFRIRELKIRIYYISKSGFSIFRLLIIFKSILLIFMPIGVYKKIRKTIVR